MKNPFWVNLEIIQYKMFNQNMRPKRLFKKQSCDKIF